MINPTTLETITCRYLHPIETTVLLQGCKLDSRSTPAAAPKVLCINVHDSPFLS
jgi:hypothetical protein